jgi:zinc protease
MAHRNKFLCALLSALLLGLANATSASPVVETMTLPNGMQVVVIPNHKVPAVSHILWFRVGAIDDPEGKSGLAHYHEHMMFQGTKRYPDEQYSTIIRSLGGEKNAFTSKDFTAYMINIAKEHLGKAMELEADRMMNLDPPLSYFDRERKVIIEERKQVIESSAARMLDEQMDAALFRNHPYGVPVIGWLHEMEGLTADDVRKLHREFYKPRNAYLIVTGDVTMKDVAPLARKYYGNLPPGPETKRVWKMEPPQNVERRVTYRHPEVTKPQWSRTYIAPSVNVGNKEQVYALDILAQVLGGGSSSRLYRALVMEQKIAVSVAAGYNGYALGSGDFTVHAVPAQGVTPERIEQAVEREIERLKTELVTKDELTTAQTLYNASLIYERDGLQGMNYTVGSLMAVGLPADYILHVGEAVNRVTPEEIRTASQQVLIPSGSVTGVLLPESKGSNP